MNIGDGYLRPQEISTAQNADSVTQKATRARPEDSAAKEGLQVDQAHVSSAAALAKQAATEPDVRMEKINGIQQALAAGNYQISSSDLADSLLNHMLQK